MLRTAGALFQYEYSLFMYGIPISKIRRSRDPLIFDMGIPIPVRPNLYIEVPPGFVIILYSVYKLVPGALVNHSFIVWVRFCGPV